MRRILLSTLLLTLLLAAFVFLMQRDKPHNTNVADATPVSVSDFPVITPDNVDRLTPVVTLTRGGRNFENPLQRPVWSPDGGTVAVVAGGSEGVPGPGIWLYDVENREMPSRQFEHESAYSMAFSADGRWLATLSDTGYVGGRAVVWDIEASVQILVLRGEDVRIRGMHFNSDGRRFITDDANNVWIWDIATGNEVIEPFNACSVAFNDEATLAAGSNCEWSGVITLYDLETGQQARIGAQRSLVGNITFSPDNRWIAASDNEWFIALWGLAADAGDLKLTFGDGGGYVPYTRFSPDSVVLAAWMRMGGTIELWSVPTGHHLFWLEGHPVAGGSSLDVTFSPDGALIASSWGDYGDTEDRNLRLWDAASGEPLRTIPDEFSATFSPDGTMLATDSSDGSVKIWAVRES